MRRRERPPPRGVAVELDDVLDRYRTRLASQLAGQGMADTPAEARCRAAILVDAWLGDDGVAEGDARDRLLRDLVDELTGLGPLEPLLGSADVTEIMVNAPDSVHVEIDGVIRSTGVRFRDAEHVRAIVERLLVGSGRRLDEACPMVDARLDDGSRVNAVLPPVAVGSPQLTIRRPPRRRLSLEDLLDAGALDGPMAAFLHAAVLGRCNILVCGGAGTGKTTLLAALCDLVPESQRLLVLEDVAELAIGHPHAVRQETRPATAENGRELGLAELVRNALRMRPDRLIVGEVRGVEAAGMVAAMNTGHEGSMTTLHANSAGDALARLMAMLALAWPALDPPALDAQVAAALDVVVHCRRDADGRRSVASIATVERGAANTTTLTPVYRNHGAGAHERVASACGEVPRGCLERMAEHGVLFPPALFARRGAA